MIRSLVALSIAVSATTALAQLSPTAREARDRAISCFEDLKFRCAVGAARRALKALPPAAARSTRLELYVLLGRSLVALDRFGPAKAVFRDLLDLAPRYRFPDSVSPKIRRVFREAARQWRASRPKPRPKPKPKPPPQPPKPKPRPPTPKPGPKPPVVKPKPRLIYVPAPQPTPKLFVDAALAYSLLVGSDSDALQNGFGGAFAAGYAFTPRLAASFEIGYLRFSRRGEPAGNIDLVTLAPGVRLALTLGRASVSLGASVGIATFGASALTDRVALALQARLRLDVPVTRNLTALIGLAPGLLVASASSFYLPIELGLRFHF